MTGRYKAYPEYKDSGLRWLPELPSNWKVERTKRMFYLKRSLVGNQSSDYQLLSLTLKGVVPRDISSGEGKIPENFDTYQKVDENDLIFCLFDMDETPRTIGISPLNGMITGAYNVYGCLDGCCADYAYYYFLHIDSFKGLKPFYTGLRKVVRAETFGNIEMPCPSFEEQQQIANFLDHETAKIDTLITKQEKLIELLKEKRQAVISHAVTKGLNPDAPMKDSGVEWLGEVPEHWEVKRVRHTFQIDNNLRTPLDRNVRASMSGKYRYYGPTGVLDNINTFNIEGEYFLIGEDGDHFLKFKDKVMSIYVEGQFNVNNHAHLLKGSDSATTKWGCLYFEHMDLFPWLLKQGVGRYKLQKTILQDIPVFVPPKDEMENIIVEMEKQKDIFNQMDKKATRAITLLKERKTALISAAVTGKIDIRNWDAQGVQG